MNKDVEPWRGKKDKQNPHDKRAQHKGGREVGKGKKIFLQTGKMKREIKPTEINCERCELEKKKNLF